MKKITIVIIAAVVLLSACRKVENATYHATDNIYFNLEPYGYKDSILYSFALHPEKVKDTVWVPVKISGNRTGNDRTYGVQLIDTATTAKVGLHYEALKETYVFKGGNGSQMLPVVLYSNDTMLVHRTYTLSFKLVPTGDFNTELVELVKARLVFSNKLEKPRWWDMWLGGYYSQVKHMLFRLAATTEELSTSGLDAPKNLYYVERLKVLLNGPKTWCDMNPDKGYVLTPRSDGDFDFHPVSAPEKSIQYRKDAGTGKFFFIDENGAKVI